MDIFTTHSASHSEALHTNASHRLGGDSAKMNRVTCKLIFRKHRKNEAGQMPLSFQFFINKKKKLIAPHIIIEPKYLGSDGMIKSSHPNADEYNTLLTTYRSRWLQIVNEYNHRNKYLSADDFEKAFYVEEYNNHDFIKWCTKEINDRPDFELGKETRKHHLSQLNKLQEFKKNVQFGDLTEKFITDYIKHLSVKKSNGINTRANTMKFLSAYLKRAKKQGLFFPEDIFKMKITTVNSNKEALTQAQIIELMQLFNQKKLPPSTQITLGYFLFSIFTGLRVSDWANMQDLRTKNALYILLPVKTKRYNKQIKVPVSPQSEFYYQYIQSINFYKPADVELNRQLKNIGEEIKCEFEISTHTGRRTFITTLLDNEMPSHRVKSIVGHSSIVTTEKYATANDEGNKKMFHKFAQIGIELIPIKKSESN